MPVFKIKNKNLYLLTNYKVMYSTLKHQKDLERILISKKIKRSIILNTFWFSKVKFYFIVRNPYDKIESFFREKFRKSLNYYDENGFWQDSQIVFFPFLDIQDSMTAVLIKEKLRSTSFTEMISILPKIYMLDGHLTPQWTKKRICYKLLNRNFYFAIKTKKTFKLESQKDLKELNNIFNINTDLRINATSSIKEALIWSKADRDIVEDIYKEDFKLFNYKKKNQI
jgi:hypothetical protein